MSVSDIFDNSSLILRPLQCSNIDLVSINGVPIGDIPFAPVGPTGPQGLTGPTGPQGVIGLTGPTGPQGATGVIGPQGPTGPQGVQGIQGVLGPIGLQGPQGIQGEKGDDGDIGPQGPQGIAGSVGAQGPAGATGPAGAQGATGPQGIQGLTGPQGIQGITGPTGPAGPALNPLLPLVNTNDTESTSVSTGAITTLGGLGVAKNVFCNQVQTVGGRFLVGTSTNTIPGFAFASQTGLGMNRSGANQIAFVNAGTILGQISNSGMNVAGRLGIGITSVPIDSFYLQSSDPVATSVFINPIANQTVRSILQTNNADAYMVFDDLSTGFTCGMRGDGDFAIGANSSAPSSGGKVNAITVSQSNTVTIPDLANSNPNFRSIGDNTANVYSNQLTTGSIVDIFVEKNKSYAVWFYQLTCEIPVSTSLISIKTVIPSNCRNASFNQRCDFHNFSTNAYLGSCQMSFNTTTGLTSFSAIGSNLPTGVLMNMSLSTIRPNT